LNENVIGNKEKSWSGSAGDQRAGKTARQHRVSFDLRHSDNPSFVVRPLPERSHERPQRPWCTSSWVTRTRIISNIASSLFVRLGRRARAFHVGHRRSAVYSSIHYLPVSFHHSPGGERAISVSDEVVLCLVLPFTAHATVNRSGIL
jgi:hypothetical protein